MGWVRVGKKEKKKRFDIVTYMCVYIYSHPEFELTYDLLLGIRTCTSLINQSMMKSSNLDESDHEIDDEIEKGFNYSKTYDFPSNGSNITPAHDMKDFEFKAYSGVVFAQLREW